jgi:hypothetical protein
MFAMLTLVVCLAAKPAVCETVDPGYVHPDTGQSPTFFECLGAPGQDIARQWLAEHPGYVLDRVQCSMGNDPDQLREMVEDTAA